jgi:hypothetical protein
MQDEPWYGVRLVYELSGTPRRAYEERIVIVQAESFDDAIYRAEEYSKAYESETTRYAGYAIAFHIFDQNGPCLGPGTEVLSLIRESDLDADDYLDRIHDTGHESTN